MEREYKGELDNYDIDTNIFTLNGIKTFARVVDIYDGDTMTCVIPLFDNYYKFTIRLNGIDTCEIRNKNMELKHKGMAARKLIIDELCPNNSYDIDVSKKEIQEYLKKHIIIVWLECLEFDKYGRVLGNIYKKVDSNKSLSDILLDAKLAYKYDGGTKIDENLQNSIIKE